LFYLIDPLMIRLHKLEMEEKMREAQVNLILRQAGIDPNPISWKRLKEAIHTWIVRLSMFEKPANPCLDCPPAGV
jgi:hypothetical protein